MYSSVVCCGEGFKREDAGEAVRKESRLLSIKTPTFHRLWMTGGRFRVVSLLNLMVETRSLL